MQVSGKTFYLLVFPDVFSRFIVYHELLRSMDGASVSLGAQGALETLPAHLRGKVRIKSDDGSAFVSADFGRVLGEHGTDHHRIWPHTPEQNGYVERVMRTLGVALCEDEFEAFREAGSATDEIVHWYNHERLHSALGYLTPARVHAGEAETIHAERRQKLTTARHRRKEKNLKLRQMSLPIRGSSTSSEPHSTVNLPLSQFG